MQQQNKLILKPYEMPAQAELDKHMFVRHFIDAINGKINEVFPQGAADNPKDFEPKKVAVYTFINEMLTRTLNDSRDSIANLTVIRYIAGQDKEWAEQYRAYLKKPVEKIPGTNTVAPINVPADKKVEIKEILSKVLGEEVLEDVGPAAAAAIDIVPDQPIPVAMPVPVAPMRPVSPAPVRGEAAAAAADVPDVPAGVFQYPLPNAGEVPDHSFSYVTECVKAINKRIVSNVNYGYTQERIKDNIYEMALGLFSSKNDLDPHVAERLELEWSKTGREFAYFFGSKDLAWVPYFIRNYDASFGDRWIKGYLNDRFENKLKGSVQPIEYVTVAAPANRGPLAAAVAVPAVAPPIAPMYPRTVSPVVARPVTPIAPRQPSPVQPVIPVPVQPAVPVPVPAPAPAPAARVVHRAAALPVAPVAPPEQSSFPKARQYRMPERAEIQGTAVEYEKVCEAVRRVNGMLDGPNLQYCETTAHNITARDAAIRNRLFAEWFAKENPEWAGQHMEEINRKIAAEEEYERQKALRPKPYCRQLTDAECKDERGGYHRDTYMREISQINEIMEGISREDPRFAEAEKKAFAIADAEASMNARFKQFFGNEHPEWLVHYEAEQAKKRAAEKKNDVREGVPVPPKDGSVAVAKAPRSFDEYIKDMKARITQSMGNSAVGKAFGSFLAVVVAFLARTIGYPITKHMLNKDNARRTGEIDANAAHVPSGAEMGGNLVKGQIVHSEPRQPSPGLASSPKPGK
ncbi:MAG: hypothetical protein V4490_04225 [Pseudomonadota bacterium]